MHIGNIAGENRALYLLIVCYNFPIKGGEKELPNFFFIPETYPFMHENTEIGTITIDCDKDGKYTFKIDIPNSVHAPWALQDLNDRFIPPEQGDLHYKLTRNWVEERIFPEERHNADEILEKLGLAFYDELAIIKKTRLSNRYDKFWMKVNESDTYNETILSRWR